MFLFFIHNIGHGVQQKKLSALYIRIYFKNCLYNYLYLKSMEFLLREVWEVSAFSLNVNTPPPAQV